MLDELLDSLTDRSRDRHGKSGGLLGKLGQLLEGDFDGERRQSADRKYDSGDERDRYAASRRDDRSYRDDDDDAGDDAKDRDRNRHGKRPGFDLDFGD